MTALEELREALARLESTSMWDAAGVRREAMKALRAVERALREREAS